MGGTNRKGGSRSLSVKAIVDSLREQGWTVTLEGHSYRCVPPVREAAIVFVSTTAHDHRSIRNAVRDLRHSGADTSKLPKS